MKRKGYYKRGKRFYLRYRDSAGVIQRVSMGPEVTTEAQAKSVRRQFDKKRRDDKLGIMDPSRCTLDQFTREYVAHRAALNLSDDTVRRDGQSLRSMADVLGGDCLLRTITSKKAEQWAAVLLARGVKPTTINSYLRHIRAALNTAVEWDRLAKAPRLKGLREPSRLPRALTPQEAARLLFKEKNLEKRGLWRFLLWTGLRRQEVADLKWSQIHLEGSRPYLVARGKGDKERVVPLLPEAVRALRAMGTPSDLGPVWRFTLRWGEVRPVTPYTLSCWLKDAARRVGAHDTHLHDLRHTAATWMAARGVSEHAIQEIMGHVSITTTQIYTRGMARVADLYELMSRGLK